MSAENDRNSLDSDLEGSMKPLSCSGNSLPELSHPASSEYEPSGKILSEQQASIGGRYQLGTALLAFFIWGGWAFFVNVQEDSVSSALLSGLIQATFSGMVTLFMVSSVTWLYRRFRSNGLNLFLPAIVTTLITGSCITSLHIMADTANVFGTVLPGIIASFCFNLVTTFQLKHSQAKLER